MNKWGACIGAIIAVAAVGIGGVLIAKKRKQ